MSETEVAEFENIRNGLFPAYASYCKDVSPRAHALALETCTFAYWLCSTRYAKTPADFGSGFSSYVLRRYAKSVRGAGTQTQVTSVDTDQGWLDKTGEFLRRYRYPVSGLMMWDEWLAGDSQHDLIVYDMANGDTREAGMPIVVERLESGGMILFDDAHHTSHCAAMVATADRFGLELLDVREATLDIAGRFALAAIKP